MVLKINMKLCVSEPNFLKKKFFLQKSGKWTKNGPCSCTNPIFEKIFVPEIWAKMSSANQIAGFFNQPYLQNKSMKKLDFVHVDTNSHKLKVNQKFLSGHGQKWAWPVWLWDSKIYCMSRMN